jgi:intracellular septation protein A
MNAATMAQVPAPNPAPNSARAIVIDIALNVALPYGSYALLHDIGQSESRALIGSALIPTAVAIASIVQRRRMNALSLLVIGATVLSLGATVLSGSAWFALVRPSFITGAIAIVFALSLLARRPTLFYLARDTMCATAEAAAEFETHWDRPGFRRSMRRLTIVWAAFLAGEALLRLAIAAIWPNPAVIAATQIAWIVLPVLLVRWSIRAGRRWGQE